MLPPQEKLCDVLPKDLLSIEVNIKGHQNTSNIRKPWALNLRRNVHIVCLCHAQATHHVITFKGDTTLCFFYKNTTYKKCVRWILNQKYHYKTIYRPSLTGTIRLITPNFNLHYYPSNTENREKNNLIFW